MKKFLTLLFFALLCTSANAWDVIITREGGKIEGRIEEVSDATIKYRKASNPDGPLFVIEVKEIATVIYENGDVQAFETQSVSEIDEDTKDLSNQTEIVGDKAMLNIAFPPYSSLANFVNFYIFFENRNDDNLSFMIGPFRNATYASVAIPIGKYRIHCVTTNRNLHNKLVDYDIEGRWVDDFILKNKQMIVKDEVWFLTTNNGFGCLFTTSPTEKFERNKAKCTKTNVSLIHKK